MIASEGLPVEVACRVPGRFLCRLLRVAVAAIREGDAELVLGRGVQPPCGRLVDQPQPDSGIDEQRAWDDDRAARRATRRDGDPFGSRDAVHLLGIHRRARQSGLVPSMGSIGDCYDNAMIEAFWSRMQVELHQHHIGGRLSQETRLHRTRGTAEPRGNPGRFTGARGPPPATRGGDARTSFAARAPQEQQASRTADGQTSGTPSAGA